MYAMQFSKVNDKFKMCRYHFGMVNDIA